VQGTRLPMPMAGSAALPNVDFIEEAYFFSQLYCYIVCSASAIVIIILLVCVRPSVMLCIVALTVGVGG